MNLCKVKTKTTRWYHSRAFNAAAVGQGLQLIQELMFWKVCVTPRSTKRAVSSPRVTDVKKAN